MQQINVQEEIRKLRINEFNRLLPMVRETISLNKSLLIVRQEKKQKEAELFQVEKSISYLDELILMYANYGDEQAKASLQELKSKQEEKKAVILSDIELIAKKEQEQCSFWKLQLELYQSIISTIAIEGGFIQEQDIKEKFLEEYIYLLIIGDKFKYLNIRLKRIFDFQETVLWKMVNEKYSEKQAEIITEIELRRATIAMFFEYFG